MIYFFTFLTHMYCNLSLEKKSTMSITLVTATISTSLGAMEAIADERVLYLLEFADCPSLEREIKKLERIMGVNIVAGKTAVIESIEKELTLYFNGELTTFTTPTAKCGTVFQNVVWNTLQKVPFGTTCSYAQLAHAIGKPTAFRAVANANRCNQLAIVVPCHRVIKSNGDLCGYDGGLARKRWLLEHEKKMVCN